MYENKMLTPYPTSLGKEFRENVMTKNNVLCVVEISLTPSPTITQLFLFTLVIIAYVMRLVFLLMIIFGMDLGL